MNITKPNKTKILKPLPYKLNKAQCKILFFLSSDIYIPIKPENLPKEKYKYTEISLNEN